MDSIDSVNINSVVEYACAPVREITSSSRALPFNYSSSEPTNNQDVGRVIIHPFIYDIPESYGIAPGQLTPRAWCHMDRMLMLWRDLLKKDPSVAI